MKCLHGDGAGESVLMGSLTGGEDELGSEGLEHDAALEGHGLGHGEDQIISLSSWCRELGSISPTVGDGGGRTGGRKGEERNENRREKRREKRKGEEKRRRGEERTRGGGREEERRGEKRREEDKWRGKRR
jgi:hypothetical protein